MDAAAGALGRLRGTPVDVLLPPAATVSALVRSCPCPSDSCMMGEFHHVWLQDVRQLRSVDKESDAVVTPSLLVRSCLAPNSHHA